MQKPVFRRLTGAHFDFVIVDEVPASPGTLPLDVNLVLPRFTHVRDGLGWCRLDAVRSSPNGPALQWTLTWETKQPVFPFSGGLIVPKGG
jgi:hypothetical protein